MNRAILSGGAWELSINEALDRLEWLFQDAKLAASMDKKSFRGWQRQAVRDLMEELNIPLIRSKDYIQLISNGK